MTHDDIWKNYLPNQTVLCSRMINHCLLGVHERPQARYMVYHLYYACSMARIHYHRKCHVIPKDLEGQASHYKLYWNTDLGSATEKEYIDNYRIFTGIGESKLTGKKSK